MPSAGDIAVLQFGADSKWHWNYLSPAALSTLTFVPGQSPSLIAVGPASGNVPQVPVAMSSMSTPVKTTIDAITSASGGDPVAYFALLSAKEPPISAGTTQQFWRGDKTWRALASVATSGLFTDLTNIPLLEPINVLGNSTSVRRRKFHLVKTLVNCNSLNTDVAVWTGLPAKWRLDGLFCFDPSVSLATVAKVGVFTGAGGTGTTLFASTLISTAVGAITDYSITAGVKNVVQTSSTAYLRNTVALGLPATASFSLEITDLTQN